MHLSAESRPQGALREKQPNLFPKNSTKESGLEAGDLQTQKKKKKKVFKDISTSVQIKILLGFRVKLTKLKM